MASARKRAVQKQQPIKASAGPASAVSLPSHVQVEFMFIQTESTGVLANHIDNVQAATYGVADGQLSLRCQLLVLFSDAAISGFRLIRTKGGMDASELCVLEASAINSPGVGSLHPSLDWSKNSRFVVNAKISAPGLLPGDLLTIAAKVGDQLRPVSRIYITGKAAAPDAGEGAEA